MRNIGSKLLAVAMLLLLIAVGVANLWLWDEAYNACVARGSSGFWCRMSEEWQIFRYIFGF